MCGVKLTFSTVLMLTLCVYLVHLAASYLPHPHNRLYGVSHFVVLCITLFAFCVCCLKMCHDQRQRHRVAQSTSELFIIIDELKKLEKELQQLDLYSEEGRKRSQVIRKRIKELGHQIKLKQ